MSTRSSWMLCFLLAAFVLPGAGHPGTGLHRAAQHRGRQYYVSPDGKNVNDGSARSPWATIDWAARAAEPGSTIHIAPGNYNGPITTSASGTPAARTRFISDTRWGANLRSRSGSVWKNMGNYVDIVGFDVSGPGPSGILNFGSHVRVIGNRVHDIPNPGGKNGGAGIVHAEYTASDDETIGNLVYNIGVGNKSSTVHGIYQANPGGRIVNNVVYHVDGWGIHLWHAAQRVTIANNTLYDNLYGGILVGAGDSPGGVVDDNDTVTNNIAVWNDGYGIQENGATGSHNLYSHNLVFGNKLGGFHLLTSSDSATINADPKFVKHDANAGGDCHLAPGSPAIDTGVSQGAPQTDFDGGRRPAGKAVDVGAFEHSVRPAAWPWE